MCVCLFLERYADKPLIQSSGLQVIRPASHILLIPFIVFFIVLSIENRKKSDSDV